MENLALISTVVVLFLSLIAFLTRDKKPKPKPKEQ
jgi:hypothetical protein